MSHEQWSSRPSAETMPGAPFAGISVSTPMAATEKRSRPKRAAQGQPNGRASAAATAGERAGPRR